MTNTQTSLDLPLEDSPYLLDEHGPVFILGCPRSGTTFLSNCIGYLQGVEEFVGILAPPRMMHLIGMQAAQGQNTDGLLDCVRDTFWQSFWRRRLDTDQKVARAIRKRAFSLGALRDKTLANSVFCYKEPFLCFAAMEFARAFPRAQFIHIVRDGRDNADSLQRKYPDALSDRVLTDRELVRNKNSEVGFCREYENFCVPWWVSAGEDQAFVEADRYTRCVWMWREMTQRSLQLRALGEARYLEIRYEDFVSQPTENGRNIAKFMGKEFNSELQNHLKKAYTSSVSISQKNQDEARLGQANEIAAPLLKQLGYIS